MFLIITDQEYQKLLYKSLKEFTEAVIKLEREKIQFRAYTLSEIASTVED